MDYQAVTVTIYNNLRIWLSKKKHHFSEVCEWWGGGYLIDGVMA